MQHNVQRAWAHYVVIHGLVHDARWTLSRCQRDVKREQNLCQH